MIEQDKQLLLADLCSRLSYGVILQINKVVTEKLYSILCRKNTNDWFVNGHNLDFIEVKPYLRPMTSMTEKERDEYHSIQSDIWKPCGTQYYDNWHSIDWLNAHHFDYRGLIEKRLAISTEEYNPYEE